VSKRGVFLISVLYIPTVSLLLGGLGGRTEERTFLGLNPYWSSDGETSNDKGEETV
jgi:hypothetical protein